VLFVAARLAGRDLAATSWLAREFQTNVLFTVFAAQVPVIATKDGPELIAPSPRVCILAPAAFHASAMASA